MDANVGVTAPKLQNAAAGCRERHAEWMVRGWSGSVIHMHGYNGPVRHMADSIHIKTGSSLPGFYAYPNMLAWLCYLDLINVMSIVATFVGIIMTNPKVLYYLKHIAVLKLNIVW